MANEPSLSELTNLRVNPDLGGGNPRIVIDTRDTARAVQEAGRLKQENDYKKFNLFLGQLNDVYKNAQEIAGIETMEKDEPILKDRLGKILSSIEGDPRSFFSGGAKYNEIQKGLVQLRTDANLSKKHALFENAYREYMLKNPETDSPENEKRVQDFANSDLKERKLFQLDITPPFNPYAVAKTITEQPSVKKDFADVNEVKGKTGDFFVKTSGTAYNRDEYEKLASNTYDANATLRRSVHSSFAGLPKDVQDDWNKIGGDKAWYQNYMKNLAPQDSVKKDEIKANEFALEALKNKDKIGLKYVEEDFKNKDKNEQAKFLYDTYSSMMSNVIPNKTHVTYIGTTQSGKRIYSDTEEELNSTPEFLKLFSSLGKTSVKEVGGVNKETETISEGNPADVMTKTKDGSLRLIRYRRYREDDPEVKGKKKQAGDIVYENGSPIQEYQAVVNKKEIGAVLGKEFIDKKDLGPALETFNEAVDRFNEGQQPKNEPKTYKLGNNTFTEEQLEKGAKKYKMTIEQYKSSIGIQ